MGFKPNLVCWARNVATGTVSKLEVRHHPLVGKTREINVEALLPDKEGKLHLRTGRLVFPEGVLAAPRKAKRRHDVNAHLGAWMAVEWHRGLGHPNPKAAALEMMLRNKASYTDPENVRRQINRHGNHPSVVAIRRDWWLERIEKDQGGPALIFLCPRPIDGASVSTGLESQVLRTTHAAYVWRPGNLRAKCEFLQVSRQLALSG